MIPNPHLVNWLIHISHPRSFLVPERERVAAPLKGPWRWIAAVFHTSNSEFIEKCGLDAYFFLRYLRMLLKIFVPLTLLLTPILICLNAVDGKGGHFTTAAPLNNSAVWTNVTGLNQLAWGNVKPTNTNRYWGHFICAVIVVAYCCYVFFDELKGYVRLRQAYLTSPQHRLRASATTVLVSAIPRKWCTVEALDGLYDVFPGGVRNIWINRNYDELNEKVQRRSNIARWLEDAQTNLIKNAKKAQMKKVAKEAKEAGQMQSKAEKKQEKKDQDQKAAAMAEASGGKSTNDPHQVHQTVSEEVYEPSSRSDSPRRTNRLGAIPIPVVGRGFEAVGAGITTVGKTLLGGFKTVGRGVENTVITSQGFQTASEEDLYSQIQNNQSPISSHDGAPASSPDLEDCEADIRSVSPNQHIHREHHQDRPISREKDEHVLSRPQTAASDHIVNTIPLHGKSKWAPWRNDRNKISIPAPFPHGYNQNPDPNAGTREPPKQFWEFWRKPIPPEEYSAAYNDDYDTNDDEALWKKYLKPEERDTMRLPIGGIDALWWIPFVGKKVDTIEYCRQELARLNLEIEEDQKDPHKYPLMNSAFIQFNHQVAAHMACQSVSHHTPMQMAPRAVEIAPSDVIWSNMSVKWWERWVRTGLIIVVVFWLIVGWVPAVAITGFLANLDSLSHTAPWLGWVQSIPTAVSSIIQGILPATLLAILLILLPIILRILARIQGVPTGTAIELSVQWYYFTFLFVQVFLVVSLSSSFTNILANLNSSITIQFIPTLLADNLPTAANWFFGYIFLQACSVSAGVLARLGALFGWFVLGSIFDNTARQKWARQVNLPQVQWGTFYPVYTNFACIGLIYCTIAPLMSFFLLLTFSIFWFVYRYQTLYITKFTQDTGGLLFPQAINQLFVGLYVMEVCLFGLFLLVQGVDPRTGMPMGTPCQGQAILIFVVFIFTIIYQVLLNHSFGPHLQYLPITLEDDAVIQDEEFARAQDKRLHLGEDEDENLEDALEARERRSQEEDHIAEAADKQDTEKRFSRRLHRSDLNPLSYVPGAMSNVVRGGWINRNNQPQVKSTGNWAEEGRKKRAVDVNAGVERLMRQHRLRVAARKDKEGGHDDTAGIADALFAGINDEIEDLTAEERDILIQRAFQHEALRAKRPVIWIPRDELGVSDDEIARTKKFSDNIWISNEHTSLDSKARVVYRKSPPDFSQLDLIQL